MFAIHPEGPPPGQRSLRDGRPPRPAIHTEGRTRPAIHTDRPQAGPRSTPQGRSQSPDRYRRRTAFPKNFMQIGHISCDPGDMFHSIM